MKTMSRKHARRLFLALAILVILARGAVAQTVAVSANQTPATAPIAMYTLLTLLTGNAWTCQGSGDGLACYSSSSCSCITSGSSGANGWGNNNAWVRIRDPGAVREFTWQRITSDILWRAQYSPSARFTGGSPSATQTPSATDGVLVTGAGTNAAPTGTTSFLTNNTYLMQMAVTTSSPYGFYAVAYASSANPSTLILLDPFVSGSYPMANMDPAVVAFNFLANNALSSTSGSTGSVYSTTTPGCPIAFFASVSAANFLCVGPSQYAFSMGGTPTFSSFGGAGNDSWSANDVLLPVFWMRPAAQPTQHGYLGRSTLMQTPLGNRANTDTFSNRSYIEFGAWVFPWNGITVPNQ